MISNSKVLKFHQDIKSMENKQQTINNMKKIQITTIPKQANVQVIELDASFIVRVARLQAKLEPLIDSAKRVKRKYNEELGKREDELNEKGQKVYEYCDVDGNFIAEEVLPFFTELIEAFEG